MLIHVYKYESHIYFRDNKIDTNALYLILLRSGLEKSTLGALWSLCNTRTPGQLIRHELFLLLAMVAVAQVRMMINWQGGGDATVRR